MRPTIVCLCGSTGFKKAFEKANRHETMQGNVVLSVGVFRDGGDDAPKLTIEQKGALDQLHLRKIDLADEVLVLNVGGYVGESTRNELIYAINNRKSIRFLEKNIVLVP